MSGADPPQHVLRPPARKRTAEPEMEPASFTVEQIPRVGSLTRAEVESAFRRRALECHPDKHPGDATAARRFAALQAALAKVLRDVVHEGA